MSEQVESIASLEQLREHVARPGRILAVGNRTKPSLCDSDATVISLRSFHGIMQYEPSEFTFTARAGTTVAEVAETLQEKNQYLPFDPVLVEAGSTLGGTVAAGVSGPGRFRFGAIRDFLLGVQFISGDNQQINAGGKVVKNAAGFDLPKFLIGSLGRLGIMTELTFKVFPQPMSTLTLAIACRSHAEAAERMAYAGRARWECFAVDYRPSQRSMALQLGGPPDALPSLAEEIRQQWSGDVSELAESSNYWRDVREFRWHASDDSPEAIIKVPTTLAQMIPLCERLADHPAVELHVSVAGDLTWLLLRDQAAFHEIARALEDQGLNGLCLRGPAGDPVVGQTTGGQTTGGQTTGGQTTGGQTSEVRDAHHSEMARALKSAMDPADKFPPLPWQSTARPRASASS